MNMNKLIPTIMVVALGLLPGMSIASGNMGVKRTEATVREVIDGDTVSVIRNGQKFNVRLLFIDAMETKDNPKLKRDIADYSKKGVLVKKKDMLALGKLAMIYLKSVLKNGDKVILESYTGKQKDRYGRLLSVIYKKGTNINLLMVREGYARVYFIGKIPEKVRTIYQNEENLAKSNNKVIWNYIR